MTRARAAGISLVLVLAGCTGDTPPAPQAQPVRGGTLTVAVRDVATLDPARSSSPRVTAQIYDSLTTVDPETGRVTGAAARAWDVSEDGLRWVFVLAGTKYSDGSSVRAEDFVFAFNRIARKATGSEAAYTLAQVKGYAAVKLSGTTRALAGLRAVSTNKLSITLDRPFAELPYVLAHPSLAPLPARKYAKSGRGIERGAVTNGPFRVASAKLPSEITLEPNTRHAGPTPYIERLVFRGSRDADEGWRSFTDGKVDVADVPASALPTANVDRSSGGFSPRWGTLSFGPNLSLKKYAKPNVRRAISHAIDRAAIAQAIYGGAAIPASGIIPTGVRGFRPAACSSCELDRPRAKRLAQGALGSKLPSIAIDHLAGDAHRKLAEAVASGLKEVGFRTSLRSHTPARYTSLLQRGGHDLAELGWSVDVPSPDGFLAQQLRQGSPDNFTRFKDRKFDSLVDRARKTNDETRKLKLYIAAETRALSAMALIPIVFVQNTTAVSARVHELRLDGAGVFDATKIWVAA